MKLYTCIDHDGHFVGVAFVIVAPNKKRAKELLDVQLEKNGLQPYEKHGYTLEEIPMNKSAAYVLYNGDY